MLRADLRTRICALGFASLCACKSDLLGSGGVPDGGVDLRPAPVSPDGGPDNDDAACLPAEPDAGGAPGCPCGSAGLCQPATGRLSVQTQGADGTLRIEVMDDNGCRRSEVTLDQPIGVPRWAPDRERLAYITATQSSTLHVIRIGPDGQVTCRAQFGLGALNTTDVAWASDGELWLFGHGQLVRWRLGVGPLGMASLPAVSRFDALGDGPLVVVEDMCGPGCASRIATRPSVLGGGALTPLAETPKLAIGPARISPSGDRAVYELAGFSVVTLATGQAAALGADGDRAPAFALHDQAIVYTTDGGELRYRLLGGGDLTIPPTWKHVFSPDWSPPPKSCATSAKCF